MKLKLLVLFIILSISIGDADINNSTTYRVLTDGYHGFNKIFIERGDLVSYKNNTFNINVGDNITWINDDPSDILTIISDQELWENDTATLKYYGRHFNYKFNKSGIYTFYIKQYRDFPKLKIIVSGESIDNTDVNIDSTNTTISPTIGQTIYPTISPTRGPTINPTTIADNTEYINDTVENTKYTKYENEIKINPILMPLDILKNIKTTGMITFIIIIILSFLRKNGEGE